MAAIGSSPNSWPLCGCSCSSGMRSRKGSSRIWSAVSFASTNGGSSLSRAASEPLRSLFASWSLRRSTFIACMSPRTCASKAKGPSCSRFMPAIWLSCSSESAFAVAVNCISPPPPGDDIDPSTANCRPANEPSRSMGKTASGLRSACGDPTVPESLKVRSR